MFKGARPGNKCRDQKKIHQSSISCTKELTLVCKHPIWRRRSCKKNSSNSTHNDYSSISDLVSKWKLKIWTPPRTWIPLPSPSLLPWTVETLQIASSHPQLWITTSWVAFLLHLYPRRHRNRTTSQYPHATSWAATAEGRICRRRNPSSMKLSQLWPLHRILHWGTWIFIWMNSTRIFNSTPTPSCLKLLESSNINKRRRITTPSNSLRVLCLDTSIRCNCFLFFFFLLFFFSFVTVIVFFPLSSWQ